MTNENWSHNKPIERDTVIDSCSVDIERRKAAHAVEQIESDGENGTAQNNNCWPIQSNYLELYPLQRKENSALLAC